MRHGGLGRNRLMGRVGRDRRGKGAAFLHLGKLYVRAPYLIYWVWPGRTSWAGKKTATIVGWEQY